MDRMVEATAYHMLKHGDMVNGSDYNNFHGGLYEIYPSIHFPGNEPWVIFYILVCVA